MGALHARALAVDLRPRVRLVELDVADAPAERDANRALAAALETLQHVVLDAADLRRVVVFAGLEHGARRRGGVTAALDLDRVEERPVGDVIGGIDLGLEDVARLEIDEPVRTGPDRFEIVRRLPRFGALVGFEDVPGNDGAGHQPVGRGLREDELHRVRVDRLDLLHVAEDADRRRAGGRISRVLPVEDDVLGGERLAVVPLNVALQPPRHRRAVSGNAAVGDARNLAGKDRHHVGLRVETHERLVEETARVPVLEADREDWVQ